ncbi:AAA family ATPase [Leucobacter sp. UCMA 4100]|uniref:ParA family protein n=1 Tax=Leucobacter sp. UCMA 4100 TaxID=2810534 RepID=UPI0022EAE707|nr:ParA family protein [Leucobacter sp. UCMA 4100]MDA3145788.1 AAA family ATPase [Leucobacter sp. UCMA 4100]
MNARVLALCNQKGGVGKTTSTFHLARAAVLEGLRVLVIDADPQGNITTVLGDGISEDTAGLADALSDRSAATLAQVIVPGIWDGLSVVPTTGETLGVARDELVLSGAGRESRLRRELENVRAEYDLILIDCAPSLDQLTINSLTAADAVVIITQSKLFSANGIAKLLGTIDLVREHYNPALEIAAFLVNQHEARTIGGAHWADQISAAAEQRSVTVLAPPVPKRIVISDAMESTQGLDEWGSETRELVEIYEGYIRALMEKGK